MRYIKIKNIVVGSFSSDQLGNEIYDGAIQNCNLTRTLQILGQKCIRQCKQYYLKSPEVIIESFYVKDGMLEKCDAEFLYVPEHLEIIFLELLKNAVRASVEFHLKSEKIPARVRIFPSHFDCKENSRFYIQNLLDPIFSITISNPHFSRPCKRRSDKKPNFSKNLG